MKSLLRILCCAGLLAGLGTFASAATMTMTGEISDSGCGASHAKMMASHKGLTARQCTLTCVKNGGKYVFVSDGKVYNISNQSFAALQQRAGETVQLTGDMNGDNITVTKIAAKKAKKKA